MFGKIDPNEGFAPIPRHIPAEGAVTRITSRCEAIGYKTPADAALGRGSQALTEWIEGFR
jgi:hypothetical protein